MQYIITEKVVKFIAHKFDGKKTIVGGLGMILLGLLGILGDIWPDLGMPAMKFDQAAQMVVGGFAVLGIGGKLQKSINSSGK